MEIEGTKSYKVLDISAGENFSLALVQINNDNYVYKFGINLQDRYNEESNDTITTIVS